MSPFSPTVARCGVEGAGVRHAGDVDGVVAPGVAGAAGVVCRGVSVVDGDDDARRRRD
jgi:hypothetical protein